MWQGSQGGAHVFVQWSLDNSGWTILSIYQGTDGPRVQPGRLQVRSPQRSSLPNISGDDDGSRLILCDGVWVQSAERFDEKHFWLTDIQKTGTLGSYFYLRKNMDPMLEKLCLSVYLTQLDDRDIFSRCLFTVNQCWAPCSHNLDMVIGINLESGLAIGEAVNWSHMVAEFTQDLNTTRNSFQYHCKFSGSHLPGICNDPTLTIDQKSIKLEAYNHGFNLPIWVPVVSETEDFIEDRVLVFEGSILPSSPSNSHFYDELAALARLPFTLPPMDLTEGEDMDWGSDSTDWGFDTDCSDAE